MKRFVLLLPGVFDAIGGIQNYNRLLVKAFSDLAAAGDARCEILVLNDRPGTADGRYFDPATTTIRSFARSKVRFSIAALATAARTKPDVLVVGHVHFAILAASLRRVSPRTEHWYITHGVDVWRRRNAITRHELAAAERVLSVSDYTRRELMRCNDLSGANCEILPCALDPFWSEEAGDDAARSSVPSDPMLLTCARLDTTERYKGVDQVIRAVARLAPAMPNLRYTIVGDGDDRASLAALARELDIADRVDFRGNLSRQQLAEAYRSCSLFVMPSRKEGFGIVFLEAAFFRKPSVGGAHGGTPEVIENGATGWLVANGEDGQLTETLASVLRDRENIVRTGSAARRRLEQRFLYDHFRDNLKAFLNKRGERWNRAS